MSDNHEGAVDESPQTVGDRSDRDTSKLPDELQHEEILLFRDMSNDGPYESQAYQIVFAQFWMPFDYDLPEGWQIIHARTEWHDTSDTALGTILGLFDKGEPCQTIVVNDRA